MKNWLAWILALALACAALTACGQGGNSGSGTAGTTSGDTGASGGTQADSGAQAGPAQLGLGIVVNTSTLDADSTGDGFAQADVVCAAVLLDEEGRILSCILDDAQTQLPVSATGVLSNTMDAEFYTKREKDDDYNMVENGGAMAEWYQQADNFAAYVVGMTGKEVAAITTKEGKATKTDLLAVCTISVSDFIEAVNKACENARTLTATTSDKLGLGIVTSMGEGSRNAEDGTDGLSQWSTTVSAVTIDENNAITDVWMDVAQPSFTFSGEGTISAPEAVTTKREAGDEYGMVENGGAVAEWYQQADSYGQYLVGRTADDLSGLAMEGGMSADPDLMSSVTIDVTDLTESVYKACTNQQNQVD